MAGAMLTHNDNHKMTPKLTRTLYRSNRSTTEAFNYGNQAGHCMIGGQRGPWISAVRVVANALLLLGPRYMKSRVFFLPFKPKQCLLLFGRNRKRCDTYHASSVQTDHYKIMNSIYYRSHLHLFRSNVYKNDNQT